MLLKFLIIVTVLFLSPLSVSAGTFLDTFEDGNLDDWQEVVPWDREPGSWEIVDGGLHGSGRDISLRLFTTGNDTWKDYTVEFDVRLLKRRPGSPRISIAARVQEKWIVQCVMMEPVIVLPDGANVPEKGWVYCYAGSLNDGKVKGLLLEPHPRLKIIQMGTSKVKC